MHISKPYTDAGTLVVNIVNPTAGLLSGDHIDCTVRVETGARLLLVTPSANRAHRMKNGRASVDQKYSVAGNAALENWPELFIPQGAASYLQKTRIDVTPGGELMFWELLAPGRVASGEVFQYSDLDWSTHVFLDERLILRERYRLVPGEPSVEVWRAQFPTGYYASGIVIAPSLSGGSPIWRQIHDLHNENAWIGCSELCSGGASIRLLARDSITLRKTLEEIRRLLYAALDRPAPRLRRAG